MSNNQEISLQQLEKEWREANNSLSEHVLRQKKAKDYKPKKEALEKKARDLKLALDQKREESKSNRSSQDESGNSNTKSPEASENKSTSQQLSTSKKDDLDKKHIEPKQSASEGESQNGSQKPFQTETDGSNRKRAEPRHDDIEEEQRRQKDPKVTENKTMDVDIGSINSHSQEDQRERYNNNNLPSQQDNQEKEGGQDGGQKEQTPEKVPEDPEDVFRLDDKSNTNWEEVDGHLGKYSVVRYGPRNAARFALVSASEAGKKGEARDARYGDNRDKHGRLRTKADIEAVQGVAWESQANSPEELNPDTRLEKGKKKRFWVYVKVKWKFLNEKSEKARSWETWTSFADTWGNKTAAAKVIYWVARENRKRYDEYLRGGRKDEGRSPTPAVYQGIMREVEREGKGGEKAKNLSSSTPKPSSSIESRGSTSKTRGSETPGYMPGSPDSMTEKSHASDEFEKAKALAIINSMQPDQLKAMQQMLGLLAQVKV